MLKPIKLQEKRYQVLVYDKYEKCEGLKGITMQVDTLEEVNDYFNNIRSNSNVVREKVESAELTIDVGFDETNYFQLHDTQSKEYVDGDFEQVWGYVKEMMYAKKLNDHKRESSEKDSNKSYNINLDVVEGVKSKYTLVSTFKTEIGDLKHKVCKTLVVHTDDRMQLLDELQKMITHDCSNYTLYLNKLGERYFGEAVDIIKQLKYGYVIEGKQSANTEAVLQDVREILESPTIKNGKMPNQLSQWNTLVSQTLGEVSNCILNIEGIYVPQEEDHFSDTDLYANVIELATTSVAFAKYLNIIGMGKHSSEDALHLTAGERFDSQADNPMLEIKLQVLDYISTPSSGWTEERKQNLIKLNSMMKDIMQESKE